MKAKKIFALMLVVLMLAAVAACGGGSDDAAPASGGGGGAAPASGGGAAPASGGGGGGGDAGGGSSSGRDTLNIAIESDQGILDPSNITAGIYVATQCLYEPLWDVDEDGNMIYVLMESYEEAAPDRWIVKLKQGVTFSNGNPFTCDDVIFSLEMWKGVGVNAVRVQSLDAERTAKIDDYTLDMYMPDFYVFHKSAASMFMIYDHQTYNAETIGLNPVGTGPYVVQEYVANSHLFLERRDDYWGEMPDIQYLRFRVMAEPSQVVNALDTGALDVGAIALADYNYVSGLSNFTVNSRIVGGGVQIGINSGRHSFFNFYDDPVKALEARYAVKHAIDPQVIIDLVYEGRGKVMHCMVPEFCFDMQPQFIDMHPTYSIGYNVELAREYAQSSGLAGQTISIITNGLPREVTTAEIIQDFLKAIDVTLEIQNFDPATFNTMQYDPEATHDLRVGAGIAPNRRVGDLLVNGVRYSPALSAPGAFPNNEYYLELAPKTVHTSDEPLRLQYLEELLFMYIDNALAFGLCEVETAMAISNDIDMSSIVFSVCTGTIRYNDLKWA